MRIAPPAVNHRSVAACYLTLLVVVIVGCIYQPYVFSRSVATLSALIELMTVHFVAEKPSTFNCGTLIPRLHDTTGC